MQSLLDESVVENICEKPLALCITSSGFEMLHVKMTSLSTSLVCLHSLGVEKSFEPRTRTILPNVDRGTPLRQVETFNDMSGPQIPPGQTWFDTHKMSFQDVPVDPSDKGIATSEFLEAAESTTTLFGGLSSTLHWSFC